MNDLNFVLIYTFTKPMPAMYCTSNFAFLLAYCLTRVWQYCCPDFMNPSSHIFSVSWSFTTEGSKKIHCYECKSWEDDRCNDPYNKEDLTPNECTGSCYKIVIEDAPEGIQTGKQGNQFVSQIPSSTP